MHVDFVANAVKLKVGAVQSGFFRLASEFFDLSEANSIGRGKDAIESDLFRISKGIEKMGRNRRFASGKQDNDLTPRLERNSSIEDCFYFIEIRLMHIADLIRVGKARIAHHIAAIGKIDRQDGSSSILD